MMPLKKDLCAPTPPMGWNSWDAYGASVTEKDLLQNAMYMRAHLKPYGWEYVVCDIQWSEPGADSTEYHPFARLCTDGHSRLIPAPNRFPSGFRAIADQIHDMGLKFGIHIMRGIPRQAVHGGEGIFGVDCLARDVAMPNAECKWNTDMYGVNPDAKGAQAYYDSLFQLYAEWGVDYVKADDVCRTDYGGDSYAAYREIEMIRAAIDKCGREMVLSLSPGPARTDQAWHLSQNANMWRITDDLWDRWPLVKAMFTRCEMWAPHVAPGRWPDCDMLPLGTLRMFRGGEKTRLTPEEQKTLMTLWCVFRSPLMMGGELTRMDDFTLTLLTNPEVLSLLARSSGARQLTRNDGEAVWATRFDDGRAVAALFNLSDAPRRVSVSLDRITGTASARARDLWARADLDAVTGAIEAELLPHGCRLYSLS